MGLSKDDLLLQYKDICVSCKVLEAKNTRSGPMIYNCNRKVPFLLFLRPDQVPGLKSGPALIVFAR